MTTVNIHIQKVLPKQDKEWIKNPDSRLCLKAVNVEIQPKSFLLIGAQIDSIWNQMFYMHSAERRISDGIYSHQTYSNFATPKTSRYSRYIEKNVNISNLQPEAAAVEEIAHRYTIILCYLGCEI